HDNQPSQIAESAYFPAASGFSSKLRAAQLLHFQEPMPLVTDPLADKVIGCAIAVHRTLGAGLYENVYEKCLGLELEAKGLHYARQAPLPLSYRWTSIRSVYHVDIVVEDRLLVELKTVDR